MTLAGKIAGNALAQITGRSISFVLNIVATVALVRYLGVSQFGDYVFITSFVVLFGIVGDFGISKVAVREMAKDRAEAGKVLATSVVLRLALSLLGMALCAVAINLMGYPAGIRNGVYVASVIFLISALQSVNSIFQAFLTMHYDAIIQVTSRAVDTALVLWLVANSGPLIAFLAVPLVSGTVAVVLMLVVIMKQYPLRFAVDFGRFRWMIAEALPIGISFFLVIIYLKTDAILLQRMVGGEAVGTYGAAYKPVEYLLIVVASLFINSVFPVLSRFYGTDVTRFEIVFRRGFEVLMMIIMPLAVVATVFADHLVELVYSNKFAASASPLRILMWAAVFMFASAYLTLALIAMNRQRVSLLNDAVGSVTNVALNLILIPLWSYNGSALAILVTCVIVSAMAHEAIRRRMRLSIDFHATARILLASLLMGAILLIAGQLNWIIVMVGGALSYPALLFALRSFSIADIQALLPRPAALSSGE